jgi:ribosomal protein S18 acetylase RimI-like enzyme
MEAAEELARARGCTSLHVLAYHGNAEAQALYRSIGYEPLYVGFEKFLTPRREQG